MIKIETERIPILIWADQADLAGFDEAIAQARNLANHPLARQHVALMPDFHVGYGMPIGGVFATRGGVVPNAVGVDIGCGMIACRTAIQADERVVLLPNLSQGQLWDLFARCPVSISVTDHDGTPNTLLEAMSCGLPPVVYDFRNGARELVTDGVNGRLIPERDADGMARALSQLMTDEELRRTLARQAASAVDDYRLDTIAARWEQIFAELVEARTGRPR